MQACSTKTRSQWSISTQARSTQTMSADLHRIFWLDLACEDLVCVDLVCTKLFSEDLVIVDLVCVDVVYVDLVCKFSNRCFDTPLYLLPTPLAVGSLKSTYILLATSIKRPTAKMLAASFLCFDH